MATSNVPRHDFAPAWLKIPSQENHKSSGPKPTEQSERSGRLRKDDGSHTFNRCNSEYSHLQKQQHSSENYHDIKRFISNQPKYRHHSVDDDYYAYPYGSYHYGPYNSYEKYGMQYGSQPSLMRSSNRDGKYQHPNARYGQVNGAYPGYYDLYPYDCYYGDPYYSQYSSRGNARKNYYEKDSRSSARNNREKEVDKTREINKDKAAFNDEFPSLNSRENINIGLNRSTHTGVWDSPFPAKPGIGLGTDDLSCDESGPREICRSHSGTNIFKALTPNKGSFPRKLNKEVLRINGAFAKDQSNCSSGKPSTPTNSYSPGLPRERSFLSLSPAEDIISAHLVTQPKNLADKKSDFLKALKRERSDKFEQREEKTENERKNLKINENNRSDSPNMAATRDFIKSFDLLSIEDTDKNALSSSLEAERRLLHAMGWNEADDEEYVITEDDKKEFRQLTNKAKQQRNGLVRTLPKTWSPKHVPIYQLNTHELNDTVSSSSSSDTESDDSC